MAEVEQRLRGVACTRAGREAGEAEAAAQYGGFTAERDVGPHADRAPGAEELEGRRSDVVAMPSVSRIHPKPRPGNLREVAEKIEEATGLRVQVLGGKLVMSPTPRGKHAGAIRYLRHQLEPVMPDGLGVYEVSSVMMPGERDEYATPDLVVLPEEWDDDDDWLADPRDVALAVEVISQSEKSREIRDKTDWYAVAGVAAILVIDPRNGTWALHTHPDNGAYQDVLPGKFGEPLPLPPPLGFEVATDRFRLYGDSPRAGRPPR